MPNLIFYRSSSINMDLVRAVRYFPGDDRLILEYGPDDYKFFSSYDFQTKKGWEDFKKQLDGVYFRNYNYEKDSI